MHFSLFGDHPDGLAMAEALTATGRHVFASYVGPDAGGQALRQLGLQPGRSHDVEEVLADPSIETIIVASRPDLRPAHLRRALQSERHVICVCPVDETPDIAYEAAMIQKDTRRVLFPALPFALHPALLRLGTLMQSLGLKLLQVEFAFSNAYLGDRDGPATKASLPGWEILRLLGGDIAEVSAFAAGEGILYDEAVLISGRFNRAGIFQVSYLPNPSAPFAEFVATAESGRAELVFPSGLAGPALLLGQSADGRESREAWESWNPWPRLVEVFEAALTESQEETDPVRAQASQPGEEGRHLVWETAIRNLELDDAARRSLERRRVSALEYPEVSEEVGFKGTMTLIGCALLWIIPIVVVLSRWEPRLGWVIAPVLVLFLAMQLLRWLLPRRPERG